MRKREKNNFVFQENRFLSAHIVSNAGLKNPLLMQHMDNDDQLMLRSLRSVDNEDLTFATIAEEILTPGNQYLRMEKIAGRLTIEQGVTEVSWKIIGHENDL